jgi:hypothetical protein
MNHTVIQGLIVVLAAAFFTGLLLAMYLRFSPSCRLEEGQSDWAVKAMIPPNSLLNPKGRRLRRALISCWSLAAVLILVISIAANI